MTTTRASSDLLPRCWLARCEIQATVKTHVSLVIKIHTYTKCGFACGTVHVKFAVGTHVGFRTYHFLYDLLSVRAAFSFIWFGTVDPAYQRGTPILLRLKYRFVPFHMYWSRSSGNATQRHQTVHKSNVMTRVCVPRRSKLTGFDLNGNCLAEPARSSSIYKHK